MTVAASPFNPSPLHPGPIDHGSFDEHDRARKYARWGISLAVVLALHIGLGLYMIAHPIGIEPPGAPPAAVLIDLAPPEPAPPPPEPLPPEPKPEPVVPPPPQMAEPPPPPPPVPLPETPPPPPEPPPPPKAVTLPKPPPPPKPQQPRPQPAIERPPPPLPVPVAPPAAAPPPAAAAPAAPSAAAVASARANWQSRLVGHIARFKQYPRVAEEQHQEGTAYLRFTMDRNGHVLASRLERSSGVSLLDQEVIALIQRAQPLPALPPEVTNATMELVIPIAFTVRR